jgi:phenylalanyl-tRNA synthetase beta chain
VPVALGEINLDSVLNGQPRPVKFKSLSKFQPVERDFAFVMESSKAIGDLIKEAKKSCGAVLKEMTVFDIYEGDKLPQGQKSVAVRAIFQNQDAALADADLQALSQKVIDAAAKSVKAVLR